jgi:23S rRNA pseudouridine2605 synthase
MSGIDSRRKCEVYIRNGQVELNGEIVRDLGRQVDIYNDAILFRGKILQFDKPIYYVLHKPVGYVTTASDPFAKKTVFDLLPPRLVPRTSKPMPSRTRVFPVGRLDKDSSGLLLMTNDGEMANHLMHPRYEVAKWYEVRLDRAIDPRDIKRAIKGVQLEDGMAKAQKVRPKTRRILQILIREGRNREVRRIFEALGYEVVDLCRIAFGPLLLGQLPPGQGRLLNQSEIRQLKEALKLTLPRISA